MLRALEGPSDDAALQCQQLFAHNCLGSRGRSQEEAALQQAPRRLSFPHRARFVLQRDAKLYGRRHFEENLQR